MHGPGVAVKRTRGRSVQRTHGDHARSVGVAARVARNAVDMPGAVGQAPVGTELHALGARRTGRDILIVARLGVAAEQAECDVVTDLAIVTEQRAAKVVFCAGCAGIAVEPARAAVAAQPETI